MGCIIIESHKTFVFTDLIVLLVTLLMKLMKANSKHLSTKSKATTKRSSQLSVQNTPKTPNETNNKEELVNIIRKVVKEELEDHEKKFFEILKSHLERANQRLNKISDEVVEFTKSFEFTQAERKEEITNIKDDLKSSKN